MNKKKKENNYGSRNMYVNNYRINNIIIDNDFLYFKK